MSKTELSGGEMASQSQPCGMAAAQPDAGLGAEISDLALPAPRLQLRWTENDGKQRFSTDDARISKIMGLPERPPTPEWLCHYELVLPLGEYDVRREVYGPRGGRKPDRSELVIPIKAPTVRASTAYPCRVTDTGERYADKPIRDGAHATWDAALLGSPPVYVIAPDGWAARVDGTTDVQADPGGPPK